MFLERKGQFTALLPHTSNAGESLRLQRRTYFLREGQPNAAKLFRPHLVCIASLAIGDAQPAHPHNVEFPVAYQGSRAIVAGA